MNMNQRPPRAFCPSCGKTIGSSLTTCPSCGAVFPLEDALEQVRERANIRIGDLMTRIRRDPVYWARWFLAVIPFFIMAPVVSLGLTFYLREQKRDVVMLTVAVANILLSLVFWNTVIGLIGDILPSFLQMLRVPMMPAGNHFFGYVA